jgi:hypothetical protein
VILKKLSSDKHSSLLYPLSVAKKKSLYHSRSFFPFAKKLNYSKLSFKAIIVFVSCQNFVKTYFIIRNKVFFLQKRLRQFSNTCRQEKVENESVLQMCILCNINLYKDVCVNACTKLGTCCMQIHTHTLTHTYIHTHMYVHICIHITTPHTHKYI